MKITLSHEEWYPVTCYSSDHRWVEHRERIREVDDAVIAEYDEAYERFQKACDALEAAYKAAPEGDGGGS